MRFGESKNDYLTAEMTAAEYDELDYRYQVARALHSARVEQGMTQADLEAASGISHANISRIETGSSNPSLKTLRKLAKAMGKRLQIRFI